MAMVLFVAALVGAIAFADVVNLNPLFTLALILLVATIGLGVVLACECTARRPGDRDTS